MSVTLNGFLAKARIPTPVLSALQIQEMAGDVGITIEKMHGSSTLANARKVCDEHLSRFKLQIEILPLPTTTSLLEGAAIFIYDCSKYAGRGMCFHPRNTIVLWKPADSKILFLHSTSFETGALYGTELTALGISYDGEDWQRAHVVCSVRVSTSRQKILQEILRNLCSCILHEGGKETCLFESLQVIGLEFAMDYLVRLAQSSRVSIEEGSVDTALMEICEILSLAAKEVEMVEFVWPIAITGKGKICLPVAGIRTFHTSLEKGYAAEGWMHRSPISVVHSRFGEVEMFLRELESRVDQEILEKLIAHAATLGEPLRNDRKIWRGLAEQTVAAGLNLENGPFVLDEEIMNAILGGKY